jgi:GT2 family glycosyltransferase
MKNNSVKLKRQQAVSVVIPMRNAGTTVIGALQSLSIQTFPIQKIVVVDNVSTDNSREIVSNYAKRSKIPVLLVRQKTNKSVSSSNNLGTNYVETDLVIFMTSDSALPTKYELEKLIKPLREDISVIATLSTTILPRDIWNEYNFWQKFYMISDLDNETPHMNAKFDCIRREVFVKIGGYDEKNFGGESDIGGEDADLSLRLKREGKIMASEAKIIHLHYMGSSYSIRDVLRSRKLYARTYGRLLRKWGFISPAETSAFLIKPMIGILPFISPLQIIGVIMLGIYSILHTRKMFTSQLTLFDPRILLLPFLNVGLLYYDIFWMIESFCKKIGK